MKRHVHEFRTRFSDIDMLRHVNNVRALTYLEDARVSFLRWDADEDFAALVIARHEVDYVRPMALRREPYRVETWVRELGPVQFVLAYEIVDDEHVYLRASSVVVGYDAREQRPRRLTKAERAYLETYLDKATAR